MYFRKEKEFQYHPAIIKMLEDIVGGGTIARADLVTAIFDNKPLDELPPYCIVGRDENGGWHVVKTASVIEAAAEAATTYKVGKSHLFAIGNCVTVGGDLKSIACKITAIDKTNPVHDVITVDSTLGEAAVGNVLVGTKDKADAGKAELLVDASELTITMSKVNLTVANQSCGLMVRGTINEGNMPFPVDAGLKALMPLIRFVKK